MSEGPRPEMPSHSAGKGELPLGTLLLRAGRAAYRTHDYKLSEATLLAALTAGADERLCRRTLARIYNLDRNWAKSLEQWQWLSARSPAEVEPWLQVARAQFRLGNYSEAEKSFAAVVALAPEHEEAHRHLRLIERIRDETPAPESGRAPRTPPHARGDDRGRLAGEALALQLRALEAAIEGAAEQAAAAARSVAAFADGDGVLSSHRQLYGLQAARHTASLAEQLKSARQQTRALAERTQQIFETMQRIAGISSPPDAAPSRDALQDAVRDIAVGAAQAIYRRRGFDLAVAWLMTAAAPDDRARLLEEFGNAVAPENGDNAVHAWRLALGLTRSREATQRIAEKIAADAAPGSEPRRRASP